MREREVSSDDHYGGRMRIQTRPQTHSSARPCASHARSRGPPVVTGCLRGGLIAVRAPGFCTLLSPLSPSDATSGKLTPGNAEKCVVISGNFSACRDYDDIWNTVEIQGTPQACGVFWRNARYYEHSAEGKSWLHSAHNRKTFIFIELIVRTSNELFCH